MPHLRWLALSILFAGLSGSLYAVDGVVLIDQNRALAGGVTPGDTPGFPVTISLPGSYRLAGNLTLPDANTTAISITSDNVTIDLNGFTIAGPTVCTGVPPMTSCTPPGTGHGVYSPTKANITVTNGVVRGVGSAGVVLGNYCHIEKTTANSNGDQGLVCGEGGTIIDSNANFNGAAGIVADIGSLISGNVSRNNDGSGIYVNCPANIVGNTAVGNFLNLTTVLGGCGNFNNIVP